MDYKKIYNINPVNQIYNKYYKVTDNIVLVPEDGLLELYTETSSIFPYDDDGNCLYIVIDKKPKEFASVVGEWYEEQHELTFGTPIEITSDNISDVQSIPNLENVVVGSWVLRIGTNLAQIWEISDMLFHFYGENGKEVMTVTSTSTNTTFSIAQEGYVITNNLYTEQLEYEAVDSETHSANDMFEVKSTETIDDGSVFDGCLVVAFGLKDDAPKDVYEVSDVMGQVANIYHLEEPYTVCNIDYLNFKAVGGSATISMNMLEGTNLMYSFNKNAREFETWDGTAITVEEGETVYMYGDDWIANSSNHNQFVMTGTVEAAGDVTTLLTRKGTDTLTDNYEFSHLFKNCTALTSAPTLPAITLAHQCYMGMFQGCTALTSAPSLPATTMKTACYKEMFRGCTALTSAPTLPSTTLESQCYQQMFSGCTALTTAPSLPATTLANDCYSYMFRLCEFSTPPALPATTLAQNCYKGMFEDCINLTSAPTLPATTLASSCYYYMFNNCRSLTSVTCHSTSYNSGSFTNWLNNVAASGTVTCPSALALPTNSASGVPTGWSKVDL